MKIHVKDNSKDYVKMLRRKHGGLPIVAAETVNTAAKIIESRYKKSLKKFTIRNKFTLRAIKLNKSKARRSNGKFRKFEDINAIVGVMKQKGGKEHYLKDQELGGTTRGRSRGGNIAMPLNRARTSNSDKRAVKGALRLRKSKSSVLAMKGNPIGVKGSRYSIKQSWAIANKYAGTSNHAKIRKSKGYGSNKYHWNLKAPFVMIGGMYLKFGKKLKMIRTLTKKSVRIKARHKLQNSTEALKPKMMEAIFKREAKKHLGKIK